MVSSAYKSQSQNESRAVQPFWVAQNSTPYRPNSHPSLCYTVSCYEIVKFSKCSSFREGLNPYLMHGRFAPRESTLQIALRAAYLLRTFHLSVQHTHTTLTNLTYNETCDISGQLATVIISHYLFVRFTDEKVTHKIHLHQ